MTLVLSIINLHKYGASSDIVTAKWYHLSTSIVCVWVIAPIPITVLFPSFTSIWPWFRYIDILFDESFASSLSKILDVSPSGLNWDTLIQVTNEKLLPIFLDKFTSTWLSPSNSV